MRQEQGPRSMLRERLAESSDPNKPLSLYMEYVAIETVAEKKWIHSLGLDLGSHSGRQHINGVETQICALIGQSKLVELSQAEIFILLCGILFHDLGRTVSYKQYESFIEKMKKENSPYPYDRIIEARPGETTEEKKTHHALISADWLMVKWQEFLFRDKEIAQCVATVCAAHNLKYAEELRRNGELNDVFLDQYGRIRIGWLCGLLALGDELDNSYHRAAQEWVKSSVDEFVSMLPGEESRHECAVYDAIDKCQAPEGTCSLLEETSPEGREKLKCILRESKHNPKGRFRAQLRGCEVDFQGRLLVVHPHEFIEGNRADRAFGDSAFFVQIWKDMAQKQKLLAFWRRELRQMHMGLIDVALNLRGHLLGLNSEADGSPQKTDPVEDILEKHFRFTVEPVVRQMKIDRVLESAVRLRFNSFGKATFPWETLATEAGIESVNEVKLVFHRLLMLANIFFLTQDVTRGQTRKFLLDLRNRTARPPVASNPALSLQFMELDGEWTISFKSIDSRKPYQERDRRARETIRNFHNWLKRVISNVDNHPHEPHSEQGLIYEIRNPELAYLLEEDGTRGGICLPTSRSVLYPENQSPVLGINLVITGPPGVGKSTLATEIVAQGDIEGTIPVCAYYSLEQPLESIRQLAEDMTRSSSNGNVWKVIDFHPNPIRESFGERDPDSVRLYREILDGHKEGKARILFLPKLAPRSYGEVVDEEVLYWFRYKQIARLLEANKRASSEDRDDSRFRLNCIVLDNLNAFSRHPLARQRVHHLFNLVAWGGVLGLHIIEDSPSEEARIFKREVESLADIVIRLDWEENRYRFKVIEVVKSRLQRNVLGKHPFKIRRRPERAEPTSGGRSESILHLGDEIIPQFNIFPSIHTQVSRTEKRMEEPKPQDEEIRFAVNRELRRLVEKEGSTEGGHAGTGIRHNAFIMLRGRAGGHKLAIAMNYIHGKYDNESALVLNMGQPIVYSAVAGSRNWWKGGQYDSELYLRWRKEKVTIHLYAPAGTVRSTQTENQAKIVEPPLLEGSVYVMNFHTGFLLAEEFLKIVKTFVDDVHRRNGAKIRRVLLNSTALLPERFPLLHDDPLLLTALARILRREGISFMIIGVEGMGQDERIQSLAAMADLKVTVHDHKDVRLTGGLRNELRTAWRESKSGVRIISSDNVTGKDYNKRYSVLKVGYSEREKADQEAPPEIQLKPAQAAATGKTQTIDGR